MKTKPRINHGDLNALLKLRVSPSFIASLDAFASRNGWTRSEAVRKMVTPHFSVPRGTIQGETSK